VRATADEAKDIGVSVAKAEATIREAKSAFDDGQFKRTVELLAAVENSVDSAHLEMMRQRRDLEASQVRKVSSAILRHESTISEAGSYGIEVQEVATHLGSAKAALSRNDIVAAAKFSRRLEDVMPPVEKELDHLRIEKGVLTRVADVKCDKCGSDSMYAFADGSRKCTDCRSMYPVQMPVQQPPTQSQRTQGSVPMTQSAVPVGRPQEEPKKKRGLFRW